jgi:hypothetical protein
LSTREVIKTVVIVVLIWVVIVGGLAFLMQITDAGESKQALNLCSAETIQIGEDIEYVYVKVRK